MVGTKTFILMEYMRFHTIFFVAQRGPCRQSRLISKITKGKAYSTRLGRLINDDTRMDTHAVIEQAAAQRSDLAADSEVMK